MLGRMAGFGEFANSEDCSFSYGFTANFFVACCLASVAFFQAIFFVLTGDFLLVLNIL